MGEKLPYALPIAYGETDAVKNSGGFLVNWEAIAAPQDARTPVTLTGSPGLAEFCDTGDFPVVDGQTINGKLYVATKNAIYRIFPDGGSFKLGTISIGLTGRASNNGLAFVVTDGLRAWAYTLQAGEQSWYDNGDPFVDYAVELTGTPNFYPANTPAFLDGYLIFDHKDSNQFFNTDAPYSLTFNALGFKSAEVSPDDVTAVSVDHQVLAVFGLTTTEFFYDSGVGEAPWQRVEGAASEHGAASPYCIAHMNNNTFVLTNEGTVIAYQGYSPRPVSTTAIEDEIRARDMTTATAFCYIDGGNSYYQLTVGDFTAVYNMGTNLWHRREDHTYTRHRANCCFRAFDKVLVGDFDSGKIYHMSTDYTGNDGDPLVAYMVPGPIPSGGKYAGFVSLELEIDVGFGNPNERNPVIWLEISNDDGKTFGATKTRPMGQVGKYQTRVRWQRLGSARDRRFRIGISDPVKRSMSSRAWLEIK